MHFSVIHDLEHPSHLVIVPLTNSGLEKSLQGIGASFGLEAAELAGDFKAESKEIFTAYTPNSETANKLILLGLGENPQPFQVADAFRFLVHKMGDKLPPDFLVDLLEHTNLANPGTAHLEAVVSGVRLGKYTMGHLKTTPPKRPIEIDVEIAITTMDDEIVTKSIKKAEILSEAQHMAMDMVNLPGNHADAQFIADKAAKSAAHSGFDVSVKHKTQLQEEGFYGLLAVNQGSFREPKLITMEYKPENPVKRVAIVGKGVTFDTGGISLKPSENMQYMKSDMGGAAAVIATMEAVARLELPIHLIGVVPSTDNMPGQNAIVPGDVISSYSGKTIEVDNTDAEGRLILADGIAYVNEQFQPDIIIDLATLTGASIIALGTLAAGMFTENESLKAGLQAAAKTTGERVWHMPLYSEYFDDLKSDMADLKNVGSRAGGACSAAKFLEYFTDGHPAWAHLDIAPVAFGKSGYTKQYSSSGYGVRLLVQFMEDLTA